MRITAGDVPRWIARPARATCATAWPRPGARRPARCSSTTATSIVLATLRAGNVVLLIQPPRGFGENPVAIYHDPDLAAEPPLPRRRTAGSSTGFGAHAVVHLGKHGSMEWLPGKNAALSASCAHRRGDRQPAADLPVPRQRPRRGRAGQAPRARHDRRPPRAADGARRVVRRHRPPRAAARRARQHRRDGPGQAAGDPRRDLDADAGRRAAPRPRARRAARRRGVRRLHPARRRLAVRDQGRADPRRAARPRRRRPSGEARVNLVLAILRAAQVWGGQAQRRAGAARGAGSQGERRGRRPPSTPIEAQRARRWSRRWRSADWDPAARRPSSHDDPEVQRVLDFAATQVVPRLARTTDELDAVLHALDGGFVAAGPSGSPLRGLVNVLPTGRNFYTVDPQRGAVPAGLADRPGDGRRRWSQRYLDDTGDLPAARSGCRCGARQRDAHVRRRHRRGARAARRAAGVGRGVAPGQRPGRSYRSTELGRPRIDVTVRISGFFRDAFPHVVAMLDDAVRTGRRRSTSRDEPNYVRAHARADLAEHGDQRRATTRIFGSKPGAYGAGILPLDRVRQLAQRRRTSPRSTRRGAASPTAATSTARRPPTTCAPTTAGSRWRRRTSTPASTTSPTATTTSSTTAAWSPRSAR